MASGEEDSTPTEAELANLSAFELIELEQPLREAASALREADREAQAELLARPSAEGLLRLRLSRQDRAHWDDDLRRVRWEMGRRLGAIMKADRIAAGLSPGQAARSRGVDARRILDLERAGAWLWSKPGFFAEVVLCGGIGDGDNRWGDFRSGGRFAIYAPLLNREPCRSLDLGAVDPSWLSWEGGAVANLAREIQAKSSFHLLPILGDALEEAGCVETEILSHCRERAEHFRACRVAGLLLMASLGDARNIS